MRHWTVTAADAGYYWVMLVDSGMMLKQHPIPFTDEREARRAAARLNVRDELD